MSSVERNERFLRSHPRSLPHALSAARMMVAVEEPGTEAEVKAQERAVKTLTAVKDFDKGVDLKV